MNTHQLVRPLGILVLCLPVLLAACGGGGSVPPPGGNPPPPPVAVDYTVAGSAVVKVRTTAGAWVAMTERLKPLADVVQPERSLLVADGGAVPARAYTPPPGWSLADFTVHPSGDMTAVLAGDTAIRLVRLDSKGAVRFEAGFSDPLAETDPFEGDELVIRNPKALVPWATRDAVRVAAVDEDLVVVLRSGRNAVLAYRLRPTGSNYTTAWRTLVEPGVPIGSVGLTSGTFDPFGGLNNQWQVCMDVAADGRVAVGVNVYRTELVDGHQTHFREALPAGFVAGVLVTELASNGARLATVAVDTVRKSELHAIRFTPKGIAVAGRVFSAPTPEGWDAFTGVVQPRTGAASYQTVDADRGEVIFALDVMADGKLVAVGSAGYTQNPAGGSISENASHFAALLDERGALLKRLEFAGKARHNQLRAIAPWKQKWLVGALENGPGTHSADGNPALLVADGAVKELQLP